MEKAHTKRHPDLLEFFSGVKDGVPLAMSIFAYGLVFGVLARHTGLSWLEILFMSILVVAGASQFVAISMIATGASASQMIIATLLLNLRHLLMGASLAQFKPLKTGYRIRSFKGSHGQSIYCHLF